MGVYIHAAWLMDPSRAGASNLDCKERLRLVQSDGCVQWRELHLLGVCCAAHAAPHLLLRHINLDCNSPGWPDALPGPADGMNRFIEYALGHDNVWFATMSEVGVSKAG